MNNNAETINLVANTNVSILLMNALAEAPGSNDPRFQQIAEAHQATEPHGLPVTFTVAGVEIPLTKALEQLFKVRSDEMNRIASKRALELCTGAHLTELQQTIENAQWKIREALERVGAEFPEN